MQYMRKYSFRKRLHRTQLVKNPSGYQALTHEETVKDRLKNLISTPLKTLFVFISRTNQLLMFRDIIVYSLLNIKNVVYILTIVFQKVS
jgi:hypothetical protein